MNATSKNRAVATSTTTKSRAKKATVGTAAKIAKPTTAAKPRKGGRASALSVPAAGSAAGSEISQASFATATSAIEEAQAALAISGQTLSGEQVRAVLKMPSGAEKVVSQAAALSTQFKVEAPTFATADLSALLEEVESLDALRALLAQLTKAVYDYSLQRRSDCWSATLTLYAILQRVQNQVPGLPVALAPVTKFLSKSAATKKAKAKARVKSAASAPTSGASSAPAAVTQTAPPNVTANASAASVPMHLS